MAELRAMESVVVYSSPTCVHCQAAKAFLTASGVDLDEVDVREDVEGREELIELTGQLAVPVIVVGETVVQGFDRPRLQALLGLPPAR
jgi:glutaredoxin-like YruB-family protein